MAYTHTLVSTAFMQFVPCKSLPARVDWMFVGILLERFECCVAIRDRVRDLDRDGNSTFIGQLQRFLEDKRPVNYHGR